MSAAPPAVRRLVEGVLGEVDTWRPSRAGHTPASKWLVRSGARRAFVKAASERAELEGLRNECAVLLSIASPHVPRVFGAHVEGPTAGVLVLEDLSAARWPLPWPDDLEELVAQVRTLHAQPVPAGLVPFANEARRGWAHLSEDARALAALGIEEAWLREALPELLAAEREVDFEGRELVHGALGAPNLCTVEGRGVVVVDWEDAGAGNGDWDVALLALDVRHTTGGARRIALPAAGGWAAHLAASLALGGSAPPPEWVRDGPALRADQRALARTALAWACEELGLPPPPGR